MKRLIIIGAGGHGRVVADATDISCVFLDDDLTIDGVIGVPADLSRIRTKEDGVVVAIGDNHKRFKVLSLIDKPTVVIHQSSTVSTGTKIGEGSVVFAGALIQIGAVLGKGCIVNTGATIDHDCVLEDCVHVSPGANLGGDVVVGSCSWIGIGACVKHGIKIGRNVIVGAGAAVINDIPDNTTVVGVPAKVLK